MVTYHRTTPDSIWCEGLNETISRHASPDQPTDVIGRQSPRGCQSFGIVSKPPAAACHQLLILGVKLPSGTRTRVAVVALIADAAGCVRRRIASVRKKAAAASGKTRADRSLHQIRLLSRGYFRTGSLEPHRPREQPDEPAHGRGSFPCVCYPSVTPGSSAGR